MPGESEQVRTQYLDSSLVENLCSSVTRQRYDAMAELPEALSLTEVQNLSERMWAVYPDRADGWASTLRKKVFLQIGTRAIEYAGDLVTGQNIATSLLKDDWEFWSWLSLRRKGRKAQKTIINSILDGFEIGPDIT